MTPGTCRLCLETRFLCRSHILPELVYKPIYDDRHTAHRFHPTSPDKASKMQTGVWEPLLCWDCEQLLSKRYETPFRNYWFAEGRLEELQTAEQMTLHGIDYSSFKLFHLSLLFRSSVASRPEFASVRLGKKHEDRMRRALFSAEAPGEDDYPIVCDAIRSPEGGGVYYEWIASPDVRRDSEMGVSRYRITFGGCCWSYFVASRVLPGLRDVSLREDGRLRVVKKDWALIGEVARRMLAEGRRR